jgi:hypothetical protein
MVTVVVTIAEVATTAGVPSEVAVDVVVTDLLASRVTTIAHDESQDERRRI